MLTWRAVMSSISLKYRLVKKNSFCIFQRINGTKISEFQLSVVSFRSHMDLLISALLFRRLKLKEGLKGNM